MSTICHLVFVKSKYVYDLVQHGDYYGIVMMFLGSVYPYIAFKYACGSLVTYRYIFVSIITVLTILSMWATGLKIFETPNRRVALLACYFVSCLFPFVYLHVLHDSAHSLNPEVGSFARPIYVHLSSLIFYVSRFPECCSKTGKFDYCGASH